MLSIIKLNYFSFDEDAFARIAALLTQKEMNHHGKQVFLDYN